MAGKWIRTAKITSELFILVFGLWTIATNLAVVTQLPFKYLPVLFLALTVSALFFMFRSGFFNAWRSKTEVQYNSVVFQKHNYVSSLFLGLTVIAVVLITIFGHKAALDEAHYLRTAVAMVDNPQNPVLLMDALGLFANAPLFITVYKAHSIEAFCATISYLTGLPVIYIFHFILPAIGALLTVMAYLFLFRILFPNKAVLATIILFVLLYTIAFRSQGLGVLMHMQLGKGFLLGVVLPLILAYGLKASTEKSGRNWLMLTLVQIVAIGMNATALWLAPVVANLAVLSGTIYSYPKLNFKNIGFGMLSSLYVILFGLYIYFMFKMPPFYVELNTSPLSLIVGSYQYVFGHGIVLYLSVIVICFSWIFAPNRLSRIVCIVFPVFTLLIFFNPITAGFMARNFISEQTYWRTIWIIPFHLFIGIIGISPFFFKKIKWSLLPRILFIVFVFSMFLFYSPFHHIFSKHSKVEFKAPSLKVTEEYKVAKQINTLLDTDDVLLSPNIISIWISTMHHHPGTLIYRIMIAKKTMRSYLKILKKKDPDDLREFKEWSYWYKPFDYVYPSNSKIANDIRQLRKEKGLAALQIFLDYEFKLDLKQYISGNPSTKNVDEYLQNGLQFYNITAVCLPEKNKKKNEIIKVLQSLNFIKIDTFDGFELWGRR